MNKKKELLILALMVLGLVLGQIIYSHSLYGQLSVMADEFSEANAVRAGAGYAAHGFAANAGLPEVNSPPTGK